MGLLGLAPAAHALAMMLDVLGAKLIGYDPAVHCNSPTWERLRVQPVGLQELVAHADAVAVQVLYASRYEHFIDDKVLAHCKPGQVWTGTTRCSIFEPLALARALSDGRIDAAMLDGGETGFAARGTPLAAQKNLYLTPRLGSSTRECRARASWYVAQRLHETLSAPRPSGFDSLISGPVPLDSVPPPDSRPAPLPDPAADHPRRFSCARIFSSDAAKSAMRLRSCSITGRGRLGDEGLVGKLALRLGEFAVQALLLLGKARLLGGDVDLHEQAQARVAGHCHRRGLRRRRPGGFVVEHLHLAQLGQRLQHRRRGADELGIAHHVGGQARRRRHVHLAAQVAAGVHHRLQLGHPGFALGAHVGRVALG
jgi:hypothetical protein